MMRSSAPLVATADLIQYQGDEAQIQRAHNHLAVHQLH